MSNKPDGQGKPQKADKPDKNKRPAAGLGSLAAQLVQQGLLHEGRARALAREQRAEERGLGRKAVDAREGERAREVEQERAARAAAHREQALALSEGERAERIAKTVEAHRAPAAELGNRRFFFIARDRRVPFVNVSDRLVERLERGEAGIVAVRLPAGRDDHVAVIGRDALATLATLDPEAVRFWNR